jgi:hypothetical protein
MLEATMLIRTVALAALLLVIPAVTISQEPAPDTVLVLKNGSEVRGVFLSLQDGKYAIRLSDGRDMEYPAEEVASMQRIPLATPSIAPPPVPALSDAPLQPCLIFFTEATLDKSLYTDVKELKISKKWYGGSDEMYIELADRLKKIGADGAYSVHTWQAPSGFSWSAPHIGGRAFTWTDAGRKALATLKGRCF